MRLSEYSSADIRKLYLDLGDRLRSDWREWRLAISAYRDNPLPPLWQLQDERRLGGRSRWFASPGLSIFTLLASAVCATVLIRQILALWQGRSAGLSPLPVSAALFTGINVLLCFIGLRLLLFSLARLFLVMRNSIALLETGSSARFSRFDDMLSLTPLSDAQVILAQLRENFRLLLPSLAGLSWIASLLWVSMWFADMNRPLPNAAELAHYLLTLPVLSLLSSCLALGILSLLLIGAGLLKDSSRVQLCGAVSILLMQWALPFLLAFAADELHYGSRYTNLIPSYVLSLLPIGVLFCIMGVALFSDFFRRSLASLLPGWLAYGLFLNYLVCFMSSLTDYLEEYALAPFILQISLLSMQSFNVIPLQGLTYQSAVVSYMKYDNQYNQDYFHNWYGFAGWQVPISLFVLQLVLLVLSAGWAKFMLRRRRLGQHE